MMTVAQSPDLELLQTENAQLRHTVTCFEQTLTDYQEKITHLEEQFSLFKRQLFGKKSERNVSHVNPEQLELEGFETLETHEQESKTVAAHTRRKSQRNGQ